MGSTPRRKKPGTGAERSRKKAKSRKTEQQAAVEYTAAGVELTRETTDEGTSDRAFADALANAFMVPVADVDPFYGAADHPAEQDNLGSDLDGNADCLAPTVELPFIVDPPTPLGAHGDYLEEGAHQPDGEPGPIAEAVSLESEPWVDLVLEPTPRTARDTDAWVDQVLEPTRLPLPARPRRARAPATDTPKKGGSAKAGATRAAVRSAPAIRAAESRPASANSAVEASGQTRWWLVAPVLLIVAIVLYMNRPGQRHAPVPAGVLGKWSTTFWAYEYQILEIKADTVVATIDEPEEGRYAITKVETSDAGRETAVTITYRLTSGIEKELEFLADKDPTTALRFRAHSGLVWTRAEE
jgi:hypothetical protein